MVGYISKIVFCSLLLVTNKLAFEKLYLRIFIKKELSLPLSSYSFPFLLFQPSQLIICFP
jgi:hypothetical protein